MEKKIPLQKNVICCFFRRATNEKKVERKRNKSIMTSVGNLKVTETNWYTKSR
jgi:hypothetical protein